MNLREGRIGFQEAAFAAALSMTAKTVFASSIGGKTALWQSTLLSCAWSFVLLGAVFFLLKKTCAAGLSEAFCVLLGKNFGAAASLCLGMLQLFGALFLAKEFTAMLRFSLMENTPDWFVLLLLTAGALPLAWMGFEAIARTSKIVFFLFSGALLITLLGAFSGYEPFRLFPLGGAGAKALAAKSLRQSFLWSDALLLTTLPETLQAKQTLKGASLTAVLFTAVLSMLCALALSLSFTYPMLEKLIFPMHKLTGVSFSGHIRRLCESMPYLWLAGVCTALSYGIYHSGRLYCKTFCIRDVRAVLPALCALIYFAALLSLSGISWINAIFSLIEHWGWLLAAAPIALCTLISLGRREPHQTQPASPRRT